MIWESLVESSYRHLGSLNCHERFVVVLFVSHSSASNYAARQIYCYANKPKWSVFFESIEYQSKAEQNTLKTAKIDMDWIVGLQNSCVQSELESSTAFGLMGK